MVNIDTVYQRVLSIANKEQRGYITPLEFNLLANQAAMIVFEQYFYDRNKLADVPGNSMEYSDADKMIDEKIAVFSAQNPVTNGVVLPPDVYRLGAVYHREYTETFAPQPIPSPAEFKIYEAKLISSKDWATIQNAPLLKPTNSRPVFIRLGPSIINVFGNFSQQITVTNVAGLWEDAVICDYIAQPAKVEWGYDVVGEKGIVQYANQKDKELAQKQKS